MILNPISQGPEEGYIRVPEAVCDKLIRTGNTGYLAVYMFALSQYYRGKTDISNGFIADCLHIPVMDVVNAFLYCASEGLLKVQNFTSVGDAEFDIEFYFDISAKPKKDFRPHYKGTEISRRMEENSKLAQTYKIVSRILGKNLSSSDIELLYSMYDYYGLAPEVIVVMVEYFAGKGKTTMRALEKEAQKWAERGIDTVRRANSYIKKREELLTFAGQIRRIIGANERKLTTKELEYIESWKNTLKVTVEDVRAAYETTVENTGKVAFGYMNRILENRKKEQETGKKIQPTPKPGAAKKPASSKYDFDAIRRRALINQSERDGDNQNGV
ncbi:MAG: DnaD domain protein [Clostridia bacterium]|nr:DnaD domain protein [Clostridia bacterium]